MSSAICFLIGCVIGSVVVNHYYWKVKYPKELEKRKADLLKKFNDTG